MFSVSSKATGNKPLSIFILVSLLLFSAMALFNLELANKITGQLRDGVLENFDWLLVASVNFALLLSLLLLFHPKASMKLGHPDDEPEFSRLAWFAMLFSAGLASGILYWGISEPMLHFASNPFQGLNQLQPASAEAASNAVTVTILHWGLHGWGLYVLAGLAISIGAYRYDQPLTFSTALIPLFGERLMQAGLGHFINLLALYGTVFGVATSIGLAVAAMNATLSPLTGIDLSLSNQLLILALVCLLAVVSVLSGVARGIRYLSEINIWLSLGLLLVVLILGPTSFLLGFASDNLVDYISNVIPMGLWLGDTDADKAWQGAWTVFYWGWWLAWTPFVSLFIARISKGRSIREFILAVLLLPSLVVVLWMSVFGGTALHQELQSTGLISIPVAEDYSLGLVAMIENLDFPQLEVVLLAVVSFLLFTWLITSLDSATLVICHILQVQDQQKMKVFWGFIMALVTSALLLIDGISALQAASIIVGLPMAILLILIGLSVVKVFFFMKHDIESQVS